MKSNNRPVISLAPCQRLPEGVKVSPEIQEAVLEILWRLDQEQEQASDVRARFLRLLLCSPVLFESCSKDQASSQQDQQSSDTVAMICFAVSGLEEITTLPLA